MEGTREGGRERGSDEEEGTRCDGARRQLDQYENGRHRKRSYYIPAIGDFKVVGMLDDPQGGRRSGARARLEEVVESVTHSDHTLLVIGFFFFYRILRSKRIFY